MKEAYHRTNFFSKKLQVEKEKKKKKTSRFFSSSSRWELSAINQFPPWKVGGMEKEKVQVCVKNGVNLNSSVKIIKSIKESLINNKLELKRN